MAISGDDITRHLSNLDEMAEIARLNVAQRKTAEQAEIARSKTIGSGVDGSDDDLEVPAAEQLEAPKNPVIPEDVIQKEKKDKGNKIM